VHPKAHTRFGFPWNWNGEECVLQSRCTDDREEVQPTIADLAKFWGAAPDFFQKTSFIVGHFNAIQPWHVNRDGSIYNAIF
jgi:sulfane dehydrogenase subunit SoxC